MAAPESAKLSTRPTPYEAPSRKDLDDLYSLYELYYTAKLVPTWVKDETYYKGEFTIEMPAGVRKVVPATGRNAIDVPAQHIIPDNPKVTRHGRLGQKDGDDDAVTSAMQAFLRENMQLGPTPPLHETIRMQLLRGVGYLTGPLFNIADWEAGTPGFTWFDAEDPMFVYLEPGDDPTQVFLRWDMTVAEMQQLARKQSDYATFDVGTRAAMDMVTLIKWYAYVPDPNVEGNLNSGMYACWLLQEPDFLVEPKPSLYPYLPVDRVYSGYGKRTRGALPEDAAVGILNKQAKTLLEEEAFALSVESSVVAASGWERYKIPPGGNTGPDSFEVDYSPGSVSIIPTDALPIDPPEIPRAALVHYANVQDELETALYSGVVGGQRPVGVNTASGLAILSGQARLKFGPPLRLLASATARMCQKQLKLIKFIAKTLGRDVEFFYLGATLKASQIGTDMSVTVEFHSESPEDRNVRINMGNTLWNRLPIRTIYEKYYGEEDPDEALEQFIFEQLILSEAMMAHLSQLVFGAPEAQVQSDRSGGGRNNGRPRGGLAALNQTFEAARDNRAASTTTNQQRQMSEGGIEQLARTLQNLSGQRGGRR